MLPMMKRTNRSPSGAPFHASHPSALLEPERDASFFFQALASAHPTPGSEQPSASLLHMGESQPALLSCVS